MTKLKRIVRAVNWVTVSIVAALSVTAAYYALKPVGPNGHNCTFDSFGCQANSNLVNALGCVVGAFLVGVIYGVVRLVIWLLVRSGRKK